MKTINTITLADIMADDTSMYICKNNKFGFDIVIDAETPEDSIAEKGIHPYAMDTLAAFCRDFLWFYTNAKNKGEQAA